MEDFNKVVEAALEESNIPYAAYALTNSETMLASGSVGFTDLEKKNTFKVRCHFSNCLYDQSFNFISILNTR